MDVVTPLVGPWASLDFWLDERRVSGSVREYPEVGSALAAARTLVVLLRARSPCMDACQPRLRGDRKEAEVMEQPPTQSRGAISRRSFLGTGLAVGAGAAGAGLLAKGAPAFA